MRVDTNSIGNYFQQAARNISNVTSTENIKKPAENKVAEETITVREKELFVKMYPQKREEIMEYHYYNKNGAMSGVTVGSLLDRRG
ncbi:MAG: hypothetical protein L3J41_10035 [Melioribacteraceae bacterium]|nr:hypothetical protein [Melioribacteraceae bacterium]